MDVKEIKRSLSEDSSKVEELLSYFGFHTFSLNNCDLRCALPDGDNPSSVSIKLDENLYAACYTRSIRGDIFTLIEESTGRSFKDILNIVNILFGLKTDRRSVSKSNAVDILDDISIYKKDKRKKAVVVGNKFYDKSYLNRFIQLPHMEIIQEGITPQVANMFQVGFDYKNSATVFPHFDWENPDKLVGVKGRIVGMSADECKELGILRYWNYIKGYKKTQNLYGWNHAKENVWEQRKLIIFEGEKSVLKQFSIEKGKGYSVAIGSFELSNEQIKFIVNNTPLDCEIIFAFDKDVVETPSKRKIMMDQIKKISQFRMTSYIYDPIPNNKLLGPKDSPIDNSPKVWRYLMSVRKVM